MLRSFICTIAGLGLCAGPATALPTHPPPHKVRSLKITTLSTMLADRGMGEWGFSVLVEADGHRILFDTGMHPETVLQNARDLGIDLSTVTDVVLSHHHGDHTGGLVALRQALSKQSPSAMSRIHVAPGIFLSRRKPGSDEEANPTIAVKSAMEATGAVFVVHGKPEEIFPGVWLTGPIPRPNPERYYGAEPAYAIVGGLHLFAASDSALAWTATRLRSAHLGYLLGAHCTGIEAVYRIRELAALDRKRAVVAAIGSSFDASKGIDPLSLAQ
jgi:7,8-dihydropterin-6-yl-methyl-4-(beta-D-ribofuranosyl)aminobenzene 5'-phosphate synthase